MSILKVLFAALAFLTAASPCLAYSQFYPLGISVPATATPFILPLIMSTGTSIQQPGSEPTSIMVPPMSFIMHSVSLSCSLVNDTTSTVSVYDITAAVALYTSPTLAGTGSGGPGAAGNFFSATGLNIHLVPGHIIQLNTNENSGSLGACSAILSGTVTQ